MNVNVCFQFFLVITKVVMLKQNNNKVIMHFMAT